MNVEISGSVLSSIFSEHATSENDLEGFLLGEITNKRTDTISDTQINSVKEQTTCYVYSYVLCRCPFMWYDNTGSVDAIKLKKILPKEKIKQVVGWYKFRRNSTLRTSMRENVIHNNLLDCFAGILPKNFVFLLCTPRQSSNLSTHTMEHVFQVLCNRRFQGLPVIVVNLGDSISPYKLHATSTVNCRTGKFSHTVTQHSADFLNSQGQLDTVTAVQSMNSSLQQQLQVLSASVGRSEDELGQLRQDIQALKTQLKPAPRPSVPLERQGSNPFQSGLVEDVVQPGSSAGVLSPTNPFYSSLSLHTNVPVNTSPVGSTHTTGEAHVFDTAHTMDKDAPPPYTESYQPSSYPRNMNPFVTADMKLAPPEVDLISLRDSDDESVSTRNVKSVRPGHSEEQPDTLMDTEMSQPLINEMNSHSATVDWNNSNNSESKSDAFDFISDVVKAKSGSSLEGRSRGKDVNIPVQESSRSTRSNKTTGTSSKVTITRRAMEAIEVSSDEDQTMDMCDFSNSPVY